MGAIKELKVNLTPAQRGFLADTIDKVGHKAHGDTPDDPNDAYARGISDAMDFLLPFCEFLNGEVD